jgi:hypothetical protein
MGGRREGWRSRPAIAEAVAVGQEVGGDLLLQLDAVGQELDSTGADLQQQVAKRRPRPLERRRGATCLGKRIRLNQATTSLPLPSGRAGLKAKACAWLKQLVDCSAYMGL